MRLPKQNRHFSQYGTRLLDAGDDGIAFEDVKPPLQQHVQPAGTFAFPDHECTLGKTALTTPNTVIQDCAHDFARLPPAETLLAGLMIVERIICSPCLNCRQAAHSRASRQSPS